MFSMSENSPNLLLQILPERQSLSRLADYGTAFYDRLEKVKVLAEGNPKIKAEQEMIQAVIDWLSLKGRV